MENDGLEKVVEMLRMERGKAFLDEKICMTGRELVAMMGSVDAVIIQELTGKEPDKETLENKALEMVKLLPNMFEKLKK